MFLEQRQYCFEIEIRYLRHVPLFEWARFGWCALDERYHDVHTGRKNVGLCVGLCLRTSLMNDVYD